MKLSKLTEIPSKRQMIDAFGGYNHNIRIGEGEFYNMTNLTSDNFPSLSPRKKRGILPSYANPDENAIPLGMISKDEFVYVHGSSIIIGETEIPNFLNNTEEKTLVSMGAYIIILPDKKYINTTTKDAKGNYIDKGDIETKLVCNSGTVSFSLSTRELTGHSQPEALGSSVIKEQAIAPTVVDYIREDGSMLDELPNGTYWIDTSSEPYVLKIYDAKRDVWTEVSNTYIKIRSSPDDPDLSNPFANFKVGDGITISGIVDSNLQQLNTNLVIVNMNEGEYKTDIIVEGKMGASIGQDCAENPITFSRTMPDMDFIIESENRLWGCKYGVVKVDGKDQMVNEIYASKLGDFRNWNCFAGISTDSYRASVGTDGKFTGAISYLGYPLFFKENCVHKVYGNYPSNFQIQTTSCRGVQDGSHKSLAIVNETLFYKAKNGICVYDGSLPAEISSQLGYERYHNAVGGSYGNKYYVSMKDSLNENNIFVYDMQKQMWHREDNTEAVMFCEHNNMLYYINGATNQIMSIKARDDAPDGEIEPNSVEWSAETGIIGTDSPDKKYVSRIIMRMNLDVGTTIKLYADYDSLGIWEQLFSIESPSLKSYSIPIITRRCDHMRLKIEGKGGAEIFSICKNIEEGSEI